MPSSTTASTIDPTIGEHGVIAGDVVAYLLGLVIEREVPAASLPAFLAMYFLFLWVAWVIAVRITQPKAQPQ